MLIPKKNRKEVYKYLFQGASPFPPSSTEDVRCGDDDSTRPGASCPLSADLWDADTYGLLSRTCTAAFPLSRNHSAQCDDAHPLKRAFLPLLFF